MTVYVSYALISIMFPQGFYVLLREMTKRANVFFLIVELTNVLEIFVFLDIVMLIALRHCTD